MISRPAENEFAPYYLKYVSLVPQEDLLPTLRLQIEDMQKLVAAVSPEHEHYRYAPGKWSVREVLGHIIDGERVFGYRAFCISRGESASLASFDENQYVAMSNYDECPLAKLVAEFVTIRHANLLFLERLTEEASKRVGIVNNNPMSVRAVAYIMGGHVQHHCTILRKSYRLSGSSKEHD